jgi:acetolactate synthase-1/2/3 large subunit
MYTVQALWSMAREQTDVTVLLLNNGSYAILNVELARLRTAPPTSKTLSMLDLGKPALDWVAIAEGMGVPATRARDVAELGAQFAAAMAGRGPRLIEVLVAQRFTSRPHGGPP